MNKLCIVLLLLLASCSSKDYDLNALLKPDGDDFFDESGQRWHRENTDEFGAVIKGGRLVKNDIIPFCFLRHSQFESLVSPDQTIASNKNILWYARINNRVSGDHFLIGEMNGKPVVKNKTGIYLNKINPRLEVTSLIDRCGKIQRREKREKIIKNPAEKPIDI